MNGLLSNPGIQKYALVFGIAAIVGVILLFVFTKPKNQRNKTSLTSNENEVVTPEKPKPVHTPIEVRLYDSLTRCVYNTTLGDSIPDEILNVWHSFGRKWLFQGKWVFAINKYQISIVNKETGEITIDPKIRYRPVESLMSSTRDNPPSKVHRALTHPEVAITHCVTEKRSTLQQLMPVLVFAGAGLFILFMWSQS